MTTTTTENTLQETTSAQGSLAPEQLHKRSQRIQWTAVEKADLIARYRASGMSCTAFARSRNIAPSSMINWVRKAKAGSRAASREVLPCGDGPLVEVTMTAMGHPAPSVLPVQIHLPSGLRLEIAAGTDCAWLGQLLKTLTP